MLMPGEEWQLVSEGHARTDGPAVNDKGEMFFSEPAEQPDPQGRRSTARSRVFAENTSGANGMMFGPDGRLYAGADAQPKQIVAYDAAGKTRGRRRGRRRRTISR